MAFHASSKTSSGSIFLAAGRAEHRVLQGLAGEMVGAARGQTQSRREARRLSLRLCDFA
jgi:hypothetical protein